MPTFALFLVLTSPITLIGGMTGLWPLLLIAPLQTIAAFVLVLSQPD